MMKRSWLCKVLGKGGSDGQSATSLSISGSQKKLVELAHTTLGRGRRPSGAVKVQGHELEL